jgi:hypothetical protein
VQSGHTIGGQACIPLLTPQEPHDLPPTMQVPRQMCAHHLHRHGSWKVLSHNGLIWCPLDTAFYCLGFFNHLHQVCWGSDPEFFALLCCISLRQLCSGMRQGDHFSRPWLVSSRGRADSQHHPVKRLQTLVLLLLIWKRWQLLHW